MRAVVGILNSLDKAQRASHPGARLGGWVRRHTYIIVAFNKIWLCYKFCMCGWMGGRVDLPAQRFTYDQLASHTGYDETVV